MCFFLRPEACRPKPFPVTTPPIPAKIAVHMAATTSDTPPSDPRRKSRRRLILLFSVFLLLAGGWQAVERVINIERYRPVIDAELERLIKLPLTFGEMNLNLLPTPRMVVENVVVGEGDFSVTSPEVTVTAELSQLVQGKLALSVVTVSNARLQMPEATEAFKSRWLGYFHSLSTPREGVGKAGLKVSLETIDAPDLQIFRGPQSWVSGTLQVAKVTAGAPDFIFDIHGEGGQAGVTARGTLTLDVHHDPRLYGKGRLGGIALTDLTGDPALPPFLLDADATFALAQNTSVTIEATGKVRLPDQADALGPFDVKIYRDGDVLRLEGLHVQSIPFSVDGNLEVFHDRRWNIALEEATLRNQGIGWLVERVPGIPVFPKSTGGTSEVVLHKVRLGGDPASGISFSEGNMDLSDLGLRLTGGYLIEGIDGSISVEKDTYRLTGLTNGHLDASGTMKLDYATDTVDLSLEGKLHLDPGLRLPEMLAGTMRAEGGVLNISEFQARFVQGALQFPDLHVSATLEKSMVSFRDVHQAAFTTPAEFQGEATFSDGAFRIARLAGSDSQLSATITPDQTLQRWTVSSNFTSDLSNPLWEFIQPEGFRLEGGKVECTRLEGTFVRGAKSPEALALEATLKDVSVAVQQGEFKDKLRLSAVTLSSSATEVTYDAAGTSDIFGPFSAQGTWNVATNAVDALAQVRLNQATAIPESWRKGVASTILASVGEVPLHLRYAGKGGTLDMSSGAPLSLKGAVKFASDARARTPFSLELGATIPAVWLAPHLPAALKTSGDIRVDSSIAPDGSLKARADFVDTTIEGAVLAKKAGFPIALTVAGSWRDGGARISNGQLEGGGEQVAFTLKDASPRADQISIALEPLAPLLPDGGTLRGRLSGSYGGSDGPLSLNFENVQAVLAPELLPIELNGALKRQGGAWRAEKLAWALGASRGVLQVAQSAGQWQGRVQAERIHASELREGYKAWSLRRGEPAIKDELPWNFSGDIEISADTLVWAEAIMEKAHCNAHFGPGAVQTPDLVIVHGTGQISGAAGYTSAREGNPAAISTDLVVSGVDAVLLEGLFLEKARGLAGLMNGRVALTIPLVPDSPSVMNAMNGEISFEAKDGTLGKAGLASKLLGALRTTDILRLRIPQLKDKGLAFKTLSGKVVIEQGVFRVDPFTLSDSAYVLEARVNFDYPGDKAEGGGEIQVLEGVTGMARKIPILGNAANLVSKVFGVPIKVSGTAKDPAFGVGVAAPIKDTNAQ